MSSKKNFFGGDRVANTFIGAVGASSVTSPSALASKLSISSGYISNFNIDSNNNVSCYISRNYSINNSAWSADSIITYYIDIGGKCTYIGDKSFHNAFNPATKKILIFPNVTGNNIRFVSGGGAGTRNNLGIMCLPILTPIGTSGTTNDNSFSWANFYYKVYVNSANQTINAGAPDPDIASAVSSNIGTFIRYSTNTNIPPIVTGLNTISKGTTNINLGWTALTHSNSIDYYIVFVDGVFAGAPSTNSLDVTGLTTSTTYQFKILAVDNMGNINKFSDIYTETTN